MNLTIAISIAALVVLISGLLIERQKRVLRFNQAIQKTIATIKEDGRNCKVAIFEDFPDHEKLIGALLPYLLFFGRHKTETAWVNYKNWHKAINQAQKQNIFSIFGADWQSEIDSTTSCLTALLKKR